MRSRMGVIVAATALMMMVATGVTGADIGAVGQQSVGIDIRWARFEGQWIDLAEAWGPARACMVVRGHPTECFRTVRGMEERAHDVLASSAPYANCATPLKLRDGANQVSPTVSIYTRGTWVNLSSLSFDNRTSSFTVGACSIDLAAGINGSNSHYQTCLFAGCVEDIMDPGWDNAVSSAYLN